MIVYLSCINSQSTPIPGTNAACQWSNWCVDARYNCHCCLHERKIQTTFWPSVELFYCWPCVAGSEQAVLQHQNYQCTMCQAGKYSTGYPLDGKPYNQLSLTATAMKELVKNTVRSGCINCIEGKFTDSVGATGCTDCSLGKYSEAGATVCIDCMSLYNTYAQFQVMPEINSPWPPPPFMIVRVDESPFGWEEAWNEAIADGNRLPSLPEVEQYYNTNPDFFSKFTEDLWAPVVVTQWAHFSQAFNAGPNVCELWSRDVPVAFERIGMTLEFRQTYRIGKHPICWLTQASA